MSRSRSILRLAQLIGVGMFIYILASLDLSLVVDRFKQIHPQWLVVYVLFFTFSLLAKSMRWNVVLKAQHTNLSLPRVISIAILASFIGLVTPGRIGEVSKIAYLQQENMSLAKSAVSVVLDRLYDLVILCLFGVVGLIYFSSYFLPDLSSLAVTLLVIAIGVIALVLARRRIWDLIQIVTRKMISSESYESLSKGWDVFRSDLRAVARPTAAGMLFYTIVAHTFFFAQIYVLALGFGISVPIVYLSLCLALSSLIALLPISIGGLGTREATFIALLGKISIAPETAVLISFTDGVVLGLSLAALFALAASWYLRVR